MSYDAVVWLLSLSLAAYVALIAALWATMRYMSDSVISWCLLTSFVASSGLIAALLGSVILFELGIFSDVVMWTLAVAFPFAGFACLLFNEESRRRQEGGRRR